jgi:hypothetical protein
MTDLTEDIHSAIKCIVSDRKSKTDSILEGSITKPKKRNKLMRIADRSEGDSKTVHEYLSDEVASDSEDEKRIRAVDNRKNRTIKCSSGNCYLLVTSVCLLSAITGPVSVSGASEALVIGF